VRELDAHQGAEVVEDLEDPGPGRGLARVPEAGVARADPALGNDGGRLHDEESEAAHRA